MSEKKQNLPENPAPNIDTQADDPVNQSRRRLTGAGLGVSAIFTLASRPVLAGQCMSPSAACSGNLSQHGPVICNGRTPAQYVAASNSNNLDNGYPGGNVTFHTPTTGVDGVFVSGSRANWGAFRLKQVMQAVDNDNTGGMPNPISKEFAAALLNIRGGLVPAGVLTETNLICMWNEWMDDGSYSPQAGVNWEAPAIVNYLRTLQF
jgi:hypothetical protein